MQQEYIPFCTVNKSKNINICTKFSQPQEYIMNRPKGNHIPMLTPREQFQQDGFYLTTSVLPAELIERAIPHMEAVMMGEYEPGIPPHSRLWNPGEDSHKIRKIDEAHMSDRTLYELFTHLEIGRWAAELMDARWIQLWASQLLYKPPGGRAAGHVGWHQDTQYWKYWQAGSEVFTAWIAVGDVTEDMGAMRFVRGSHHRATLKVVISSIPIMMHSRRPLNYLQKKPGKKKPPSYRPAPLAFITVTPCMAVVPTPPIAPVAALLCTCGRNDHAR